MADLQIRDNKNNIIGYVREYSDRIMAFHYQHGYLGSYSKGSDLTMDEKGKIFCFGDGTQTLIREYEFNKNK